MSFDSLLIHTVSIRNLVDAASPDDYGNPTYTETVVESRARVEVSGIRENASVEDIVDRDTRITRFRVWLPAGTDVSGTSNLTWEGRDLRVVGEPSRFDDSVGPHHLELTAEEVLG